MRLAGLKRASTAACILVTLTLGLLVAVEVGAFLMLRRDSVEPASRSLFVYEGQPWARTLWAEYDRTKRFFYQAYVVWRRAPFSGETTTVDARGLRRTDFSECAGDAYTIYAFGGSTMWGTGSPDWGTIPSFLARRFKEAGRPVCVRNYGESAYVSTQELIQLLLELKRAERPPDLVLFYDGSNDVHAAWQSGPRDVHQNFDRIKGQFETRREGREGSFGYLFMTNTFQYLQQAAGRQGARGDERRRGSWADASTDDLARAVVAGYLKNAELVEALARQHGFAYAFFWQPALYAGEKPLTPEEEKIKNREGSANLRELYAKTYALARQVDRPGFYYVGDAFREHRGNLYVDFIHVQPEGNRLVAERMYERLARQRRADRGSR
jgi:lysophospholipase L1-like esterase